MVALSPWLDGSSADQLIQGDADCSDSIDTLDALADLRFAANAEPIANCVLEAGDVDCSGDVGGDDILARAAGDACPAIGEPIGETPTGGASPTPTAQATGSVMPTATAAPDATGSPSPTPAGTPVANGYHAEFVMNAAALGPAKDNKIELALIPGTADEAVIALQSGFIYRVSLSGAFSPQLWGDIHDKVTFENEQGLLSLAFSPDFQQDGRVYMYYTPGSPADTILARFQATATDVNEDSE